jgi:hypothetical protein
MKITAKEDKWLLVSCLQKSIRKGFEELALAYAEKLYELEPQYLISRLSIIALEDIGLGNITIVNEFLSAKNHQDVIDKRGGKDYILKIVSNFSQSVKDRTAADLTKLASISRPLESSDTHYLENLFIDQTQPVVNRLLAGWELLGSQKLKNPLISNEDEDVENFIELNTKVVHNPLVLNVLQNAYLVHREPHFIALGLLSNILEKEASLYVGKHKTGSIIEKQFSQEIVNSKWLIEGIDWHTKEGKSAIDDFINSKTQTLEVLKRLGVSYEYLPAAIGMLMFRLTGHDVNKRLIYPSAVAILKITENLEFKNILKNDGADFFQIIKIFEQDYPLLKKNIHSSFQAPDPKFFPF